MRRSAGKRPLGRLRRRCGDNVKINSKETGLKVWTKLISFRIDTSGGFLRTLLRVT